MSFWDKLKGLFGAADANTARFVAKAQLAIQQRIFDKEPFRRLEIADEISRDLPSRTVDDLRYAAQAVDAVCQPLFLLGVGYDRRGEDFFPAGTQPPATPFIAQQPTAVAPIPSGSRPVGNPPAVVRPTIKDLPNPYENTAILGLSADELRKRALKINPGRTAWIGRVDTIPPQSDERTAIIDRGLILRGLLSEEQIREIHRIGDLWLKHHEAHKLAASAAQKTVDATMEELKKQREAKKAEKKREAEEKKRQRAERIAKRRAEDIVFLGAGVSGGLNDRRTHVEKLAEKKLPVLATPADVAKALGLTIPELRWLCFHSAATQRSHYVYFQIPKRSGGMRNLAAPQKKLAAAQKWVLTNVLEKLPVEDNAQGFIKGRSTVTNADLHKQRDLVVNLDLKDFFPTITFPRVRGVFQRLGYSPAAATCLALLCTESPRVPVEHDGAKFFVATGPRALPQGACTSPALSNQVARKLDRRLEGACKELGFGYTRYADDLTFSAGYDKREKLGLLQARVRHIVEEEGFALNPKKGRTQRKAGRQLVTGIVVNDKLGVPREEVRQLRAILHNAKKTGLAAQNRDNLPHFESWLRGKVAYVVMVDRPKGIALLQQLDALTGKKAAAAG